MVLKGTPLALEYYDNPGLRFVSDVDVMVPHAAAARSLDLLASEGWQRASAIPRHRLFRARHSENLHHAEYGNLDLHWRLSMPLVVASNGEASEADFWEAAEPVEVSGVPTQMPCPEDLLLHVCVHGACRRCPARRRAGLPTRSPSFGGRAIGSTGSGSSSRWSDAM